MKNPSDMAGRLMSKEQKKLIMNTEKGVSRKISQWSGS